MSNAKFRNDIARFIAKSKAAQDLFVKKVVLEIYSRVVLKSPVQTGRFRANWQIGNSFINTSTTQSRDKSGTASISRAALEANSIRVAGQTIFISNSLPYSYRLEYEGYSKQAPLGMTRVTIAEMASILRGAAFETKGSV
jgi:hypothetical protein